MFQFGFFNENAEDKGNETNKNIRKSVQWLQCEEIDSTHIAYTECLKVNSLKCGDYLIKYVPNDEVLNILQSTDSSNDLLHTEQSHSDLVTAVYEGGLKVWECTYDLLNFIYDNSLDLSQQHVLDLGCGAGIIGILSCLKGASITYFQDYNSDVIKFVTGVNVKLNNIKYEKCRFFSGDWESFSNLLKQNSTEKFDYIFTSETIYNIENYNKLVNIFTHLLKKNGTVYLAAKYYYFGVGGGIHQFEDMLQKSNIFNYSTVWICSEGVKRAIIKITLK